MTDDMGFSLKKFEINKWTFESPKITKETTMAVISDLHECEYGDRNSKLLESLEKLSPDIIIIAGDWIEGGRWADCERIMDFLAVMAKKFPIYFGVGNHERKVLELEKYSEQRKRFVRGLQNAGVGLLRNEYQDLEDTNIRITGLDLEKTYYRKVFRHPVHTEHLYELIDLADESKFNILIAHNPEHFNDYVTWNPDLILSGHVHGGIIRIPGMGGLISPGYKLFPKYDAGVFSKDSSKMLISRGLGSHSIRLRIFNTPEIVFVKLKPMGA